VKWLTLGVFLCFSLIWAKTYTVRPGDTLWSVSQEQGVDLTILILANNLNTTSLQPNQNLLIPEAHVIVKGDTLWGLARAFDTSVEEIKRLNNLLSNNLRIGQVLWITRGQKEKRKTNVTTVARSFLGYPYRYGGTGPDSFDCSGYVKFVFQQLGIALPRTAAAQWSALSPTENPHSGDLVFFSFSGEYIDHVGIYLGNDFFIHANSHKKAVTVEKLSAPWYQRVYRGARKVQPRSTTTTGQTTRSNQ